MLPEIYPMRRVVDYHLSMGRMCTPLPINLAAIMSVDMYSHNFLSSTMEMERVNVAFKPSISITNFDSWFENEGSYPNDVNVSDDDVVTYSHTVC